MERTETKLDDSEQKLEDSKLQAETSVNNDIDSLEKIREHLLQHVPVNERAAYSAPLPDRDDEDGSVDMLEAIRRKLLLHTN